MVRLKLLLCLLKKKIKKCNLKSRNSYVSDAFFFFLGFWAGDPMLLLIFPDKLFVKHIRNGLVSDEWRAASDHGSRWASGFGIWFHICDLWYIYIYIYIFFFLLVKRVRFVNWNSEWVWVWVWDWHCTGLKFWRGLGLKLWAGLIFFYQLIIGVKFEKIKVGLAGMASPIRDDSANVRLVMINVAGGEHSFKSLISNLCRIP